MIRTLSGILLNSQTKYILFLRPFHLIGLTYTVLVITYPNSGYVLFIMSSSHTGDDNGTHFRVLSLGVTLLTHILCEDYSIHVGF